MWGPEPGPTLKGGAEGCPRDQAGNRLTVLPKLGSIKKKQHSDWLGLWCVNTDPPDVIS